jgi:signal transduction histidine kinase
MNKTVLRVIYLLLFVATFAGISSSHHLNAKAVDANGGSIVDPANYTNGTAISSCTGIYSQIENNPSGTFYLSEDIDCTGLQALAIPTFQGTLHGFGHKISNLSLDRGMFKDNNGVIDNIEFDNFVSDLSNVRPAYLTQYGVNSIVDKAGAFVYENNGILANLKFVNIQVTANNPTIFAGINVGTIVGVNNGNINAISVQGSLTVYTTNSSGGNIFIGGIVGGNAGTLANSYSDVTQSIHVSGWYVTVGGLVGYDTGPILSDYAAGSISYVTTNASNGTGGLYGRADSGNNSLVVAHNSFSTTQINNSGIANPGGILGQSNWGGDITGTNYFDSVAAGTTACGGSSYLPITGCTAIDTSTQPNYFLNNLSNAPMNSWDTSVWQTTSGLPELKPPANPITDPSSLSATQTSSTGVHLSWSPATAPAGVSIDYYVLYQITGSSDIWAIDTGTNATTKDLPSLIPGNNYTFWIIAQNSNGYYSNQSNQVSYSPSQASVSISTCQQLQDMQLDLGGAYTLTQDIDCSDSVNWNGGTGFIPVGGNQYKSEAPFVGTLNGNGYTISHITEHPASDVAGLFGSIDSAHIRNLTIDHESIVGQYHVGGGVAAIAQNATITNVKVTNLNASDTIHNSGGFIAKYWNMPDFGTTPPTVPTTPPDYTDQEQTLNNNWPSGGSPALGINGTYFVAQYTASKYFTGGSTTFIACSDDGIRVYVDGNIIDDSWFLRGTGCDYPTVTLTQGMHDIKVEYYQGWGGSSLRLAISPNPDITWSDVGGLIGDGYGITISRSSVNGIMSAVDDSQSSGSAATSSLAGLAAYLSNTNTNQSSITDSYSSTNITNGGYSAGLVGYGNNYSIDNSYASGVITPNTTTGFAGGLVEAITDNAANVLITNSFSAVSFNATTNFDNIGGIIGTNRDTNSILDISTDYTNTNCSGVISVSSSSLCNVINDNSNPVGYFSNNASHAPLDTWNFSSIWQMTSGYPQLQLGNVTNASPIVNSSSTAFSDFVYQAGRQGPPNAPINLIVSGDFNGVTLNWSPTNFNGGSSVSSYTVYYKRSSDSSWTYYENTVSSSSNFDTTSTLKRGVSYDFKVVANNIFGEGLGAIATFALPAPPTYSISTCQELQDIGSSDNQGTYNLTQDIDCSDSKNWNGGLGFIPLGQSTDFGGSGFQGTLNGNGHKIINLYEDVETQITGQNWPYYNLGLFTQINGGVISNLSFLNPIIKDNDTSKAWPYIGVLAGLIYNNSSITNVHVKGGLITVNSEIGLTVSEHGSATGGISGEVDNSALDQVSFQGTIDNVATTDNGNYNTIGGLVGFLSYSTASNSYANISITNASSYVGGLFGYAEYNAVITNSYATGSITISPSLQGYAYIGGMDSYPYETTYTNSFTNVKITIPQNMNADTNNVFIGLFAGYDDGNTDSSTSYYDASVGESQNIPCAGYYDSMVCNPVNQNNSAPNYFNNNTTNPPLNAWDFNKIWGVTSGLPVLNPNRIVTPVSPPTVNPTTQQAAKPKKPVVPADKPAADKNTPATIKPATNKKQTASAPITKDSGIIGFIKSIGSDIGSAVKKIPASVIINFPYLLFGLLLVGVFLTLSEWLRQSARLRRALALAKKQQKLAEERDTFWHLAANYLRAPVTLLVGGAELLQDEAFEPKVTNRIAALATALQSKVSVIMSKIEHSVTLRSIQHPKESKAPSVLRDIRFWLPVFLVLGFGLLSNFVARDYRKLQVSTVHIWTEVVIFVIIAIALYVVIDFLGVTSRKLKATETLIKDQEMELDTARENLIGSTAQELNTDVQKIETLVEEIPDKNKAHTILHEGARRLRRIVETFTLLVTIQNEENAVDLSKYTSLSDVVSEAKKDLEELIASKNIFFKVVPPHSVLMVPGTDQFVNQVVASVLANAVDFSPINGTVEVKLRQKGAMTSLAVSDQGQGMTDSQMSHLFSAFSRSDNSSALQIDHDGLGVSLYLDKLIMDQVGGDIDVQSVKGKGTTFTITWPTPKEVSVGSQVVTSI